MTKSSRTSKVSSIKTRSNSTDDSVTIQSTSKRVGKPAQPAATCQRPPAMHQCQLHAVPQLISQQYPQTQFMHVPHSYPYPPTPHQTRAPASSQPQPQPSSPTRPTTLESVFRETIQKLRELETTLSNTQAVTKRALVRHQCELQKWKTHCMAFKQERDAARETIKTLMEERASLLSRQPNVPPEMTPTHTASAGASQPTCVSAKVEEMEVDLPSSALSRTHPADMANEQRKTSRASRRRSPYSSPTAGPSRRLSSSSHENLPTYQCAHWDPSVSPIIPRSRASSAPPSFSEPGPSKPPVLSMPISPSIHPIPPIDDERLRGLEFASFDPIRQKGDTTAFDVTWIPTSEPAELEYPSSNAPPLIRVRSGEDCESDMELESEDEGECSNPRATLSQPLSPKASPTPPKPKPTVDIDHIDLLFTPAVGRIWCRCCMLDHSNRTAAWLRLKDGVEAVKPSVNPYLPNFKPNAGWPELRDHWLNTHPAECEQLASLNYEELWRLRESRYHSSSRPPIVQS